MKENTHYENKIKKQYKDYINYNKLIEKKTDKLLSECNTKFIFGNTTEIKRKLDHIGKPENIINIGNGGFIHRAKLDKYNKGMKLINIHIRRNLRTNFYGGLLYELANYEYILGGTDLPEILTNMGVELEETATEKYNINYPSNINSQLFNYTMAFYKREYEQ